MDGTHCETWEQFEDALASLESSALSRGSGLLFRGQSNSEWQLDTTMERRWPDIGDVDDYYRRALYVQYPIESFTTHKWGELAYWKIHDLTKKYDEFSLTLTKGDLPAYEYLLYLRHHGFPSPLLDWSRSPYVAAYFAFAQSALKGAAARVAIYAYSERPLNMKVTGAEVAQIYVLGPQVPAHKRHFLQKSEYTVCVRWHDKLWKFAPHGDVLQAGQASQDVIMLFTLPSTEGKKVLKLFDRYNLNGFSLFGSEESLMETMAFRETIRADLKESNQLDLRSGFSPVAGSSPKIC